MVAEANTTTTTTATTTTTTMTTTLKRRNSIPPTTVLIPNQKHKPVLASPLTTTTNGNHHSPSIKSPASFHGLDYEFVSLKNPASDSYTSLKDILPSSPASILSPTPAITIAGVSSTSSGSGYEISIRNRLVKQAAWAYLQPALLSSSPSSSSRHLCFFSGDHLRQLFHDLQRVVTETFTRVHDCLVDALWLFLCR